MLLLTGCFVVFQNGSFQTWLAQKVASRLSDEIGAPVRIRSVHIQFFDRAEVEGFYVEDLHGDTLLYVDYLEANFDDVYLGFKHFDFDYVKLRKGQFNVRQFAGEEDLNIQFILDKINPPRKPGDTTKSIPPELFFWNVDVEQIDFTYEFRDTVADTSFGMNYDHLRIRDINAHLNRLLIIDDSLSGEIRHMRCREHSGFEVLDFNTDFIVAYTTMDFANLKVKTPKSEFEGKVHFDYDNYGELSDFIEEVQMRGSIKSSRINMDEIAVFAPELKGLFQEVNFKGDFKGRIDHLIGRNIEIHALGNSRFIGNFAIQGLPDTERMSFQVEAKDIATTKSDMEKIPLYPFVSQEYMKLPDLISELGEIRYTGKLSGMLDDVQFDGVLLTDAGDVDTDLRLWFNSDLNDYAYEGAFSTPNAQLNKLIKTSPQIGFASFEAKIKGSGFSEERLTAVVQSSISEFQIDNYILKEIDIDGAIGNKTYDGRLKINDQNLRLNFSGILDLSHSRAFADFHANIDRIDLTALGLVKRDSSLVISTEISSGFTGNNVDELNGQIELSQTLVRYGKTKYHVEDMLLEAEGDERSKKLMFYSDLADIDIVGKYRIAQLPKSISQVLNSFLPSFTRISSGNFSESEDQNFTYNIQIKELDLVSALFFPSIEISKNTNIHGRFASHLNLIEINAVAPFVDVSGIRFSKVNANAITVGKELQIKVASTQMKVADSINVNHILLDSRMVTDEINLSIDWASKTSLPGADATLNAKARFEGSRIDINLLPSLILIEDTLWQVNEENLITVDTGLVRFKNLSFIHDDEFVRLDGLISESESDELDVILDNFQLRNLNPFIQQQGITLEGSTKGIFSISGLLNKPFFKSNLEVSGIKINKELIGDGSIISKWDPATNKILLDAKLIALGVPKILLSGYYIPSKKENNMAIKATMNNIQLGLFKSYVTDLFSDMNGLVDGEINISGSLFNPVAEGKINLKRTAITVGLLNTRYFLSHEFEVTKNRIEAKNIVITDENAHTGKLNVTINHKNFKDFDFNIELTANNLMALNTNESQSDLFYGRANATGMFTAKGPLDNIIMNISAKTERGTVFYLPLTGTGDVSQQDFITFVSKKTDATVNNQSKAIPQSKGYELNMNLEVTPEAEAFLLFDPKVGDMIKGNGSGNLRLEVTEAGEFNVFGDYIIESGDYLFTLQNVINKKFVVQKGGTISFKGDPYDADIDLTAIYRVRTSLYNLVKNIDSSSTVKRTIDVDAIMNLSDKLMKPQISFDIVLPNADDNSRNLLKSQIISEDDLNRQVFSLVMFRNFWPNQGGATDASVGVGSNASELLSSQLSNMLSQLSDDVNIGVNYSQGTAATRDQVSVNLSTQILNDRVSIDGNVGTAGATTTTQNTSNMVGEFNIEVKVTEDGAVRIKVFNRSNQYLLVTNDVPYTQGVGLFYRKEAETFEGLFKGKKQ
jgi:hypothetical protein